LENIVNLCPVCILEITQRVFLKADLADFGCQGVKMSKKIIGIVLRSWNPNSVPQISRKTDLSFEHAVEICVDINQFL